MSKSCIDEIENYLKRSITDIARKCGVCDSDVINVIKNIGKNED